MIKPDLVAYIRLLSTRDKKTLTGKALKTAEECGELAKVVLPYENNYATTHRFVERESILEECIDTCLCAVSIAYDLHFTDAEVEDMFVRKTSMWAQLQAKEDKATYPLPYEIHVTVKLDQATSLPTSIEQFKDHCKAIGVKPVLLDLQSKAGNVVMNDLMTSSKHFGDNRSALAETKRIAAELSTAGYTVVRNKIETVPWHPAAPAFPGEDMPKDCYFEAHFAITTTEDHLDILRQACDNHNLHLSKNVFKRNEDDTFVIMATYRSYVGLSGNFQTTVDHIKESLLDTYGFTVHKTFTEFSIYDTLVSHDTGWLTGA